MASTRFLPHVIVFGGTAAFIAFGVATNSGHIGAMIGGVAAVMFDPPSSALSIVIGATVLRQAYLLPALLAVALVFAAVVAEMNASLGISDLILNRAIGSILLGYGANAAALLFRGRP